MEQQAIFTISRCLTTKSDICTCHLALKNCGSFQNEISSWIVGMHLNSLQKCIKYFHIIPSYLYRSFLYYASLWPLVNGNIFSAPCCIHCAFGCPEADLVLCTIACLAACDANIANTSLATQCTFPSVQKQNFFTLNAQLLWLAKASLERL